MAVVIICCMILVGLIFIYGGWKRPYDEISSAPDMWIVEILFVIIEKFFKISAEKLMRISLMVFGTVWSLFFLCVLITHAY
ncbi:hypothetical protein CN978_26860 [Priestia megaterium]|uniref:hypothetical protein n=1 Tax=Priestia megaterium TaxID=1404 RepID=UPI000BF95019|nr:hypothetical protein [Priestia megaterium]PFJ39617.1 hypothetical protein COJ00_27550 [Priestia megaterium]PGN60798.1 hypothetical protein CN978_26860 [Priestia megaterium]